MDKIKKKEIEVIILFCFLFFLFLYLFRNFLMVVYQFSISPSFIVLFSSSLGKFRLFSEVKLTATGNSLERKVRLAVNIH